MAIITQITRVTNHLAPLDVGGLLHQVKPQQVLSSQNINDLDNKTIIRGIIE